MISNWSIPQANRVTSNEPEETDLDESRDKMQVAELPPSAPDPCEWINKESLLQLQSRIRSREGEFENLEEEYQTRQAEPRTPEEQQRLKEGYSRSKQAAKDMLKMLREEFDRKFAALLADKFVSV